MIMRFIVVWYVNSEMGRFLRSIMVIAVEVLPDVYVMGEGCLFRRFVLFVMQDRLLFSPINNVLILMAVIVTDSVFSMADVVWFLME